MPSVTPGTTVSSTTTIDATALNALGLPTVTLDSNETFTTTDTIGYAAGAGSAVTQGTNRTTGVTINAICGAITLISGAGSATPATFTVTNNTVAATDTIILNQKSGTDLFHLLVTAVGAGSFNITYFTTGGTTTEQPVFNFSVVKAVAA